MFFASSFANFSPFTRRPLILFFTLSLPGEMLGAHGMVGKTKLYEEAARVPLVMYVLLKCEHFITLILNLLSLTTHQTNFHRKGCFQVRCRKGL
jgi:hypothetical protein